MVHAVLLGSYVLVIESLRHGQALSARSALALLMNLDQCGWNREVTIVTYRRKHLKARWRDRRYGQSGRLIGITIHLATNR
ncbi:hypothetical protein CY34DRAFT_796966 [Suillus luteus UH-Slu-Lm8-n1]|uniref:Uncharacterized protein n=1 Tax=Suillus luteus UH-Slu-Lm8-n1 TaxID=930992 RepID=A0A0D0C425_9AGAM|nr:hypothetical protein CY34DRAFT_796966 [Suillus luteus UH-Slu-Lm8-n1]